MLSHDTPFIRPLIKGSIARHAKAACRVRIALDGLQGDVALAGRLERQLGGASWILEARADALSGRVLIRYRERTALSPELLRDLALDVAGLPGREGAEASGADHGHGGLAAASRTLRNAGKQAAGAIGRAAAIVRRWAGPRDDSSEATRPRAEGEPRAGAPNAWAGAVESVIEALGTSPGGLAADEAARRIVHFGPNVSQVARPRSRAELAVRQLANLPTVLLLGAAGVSLVLGDVVDAVVIVVVVGLNAAVGYRVERRNDRLLGSWRRLEAGEARALRDRKVAAVAAADLVPGDVILLRAGDVVPADARVIDAHRLACDESALTGESEAQGKSPETVALAAPLAERPSMLFSGTQVVSGRGRAVVVATGHRRAVAQVRSLVDGTADPDAPLQRRLDDLGRRATFVGLAAGGLVLAGSLLRGRPLAAGLRAAVALGVAAIPEGMPVVATAALVTAMDRMRRQGMVVRRVMAAETLGAVTVVCLDKTGTLTENEMRLETLVVDGTVLAGDIRARPEALFQDRVTLALAAGVLNSDVEYHRDDNHILELAGSSTERALVKAAQRAGLDPEELKGRFPRLALRERGNGLHYVVSIHQTPAGRVAFVKGAPEQVLPLCRRDADGPLDESRRDRLLALNDEMGKEGQRVLALAWGAVDGTSEEPVSLDFLGLVGLRDPLREGAADAVGAAARAGIRTIILTGDQRSTAAAIGKAVGLVGAAVDGATLAARLDAGDPSAEAELDGVAVLSRVTPEHKLAIVRALRRRGQIVAMAGDGINDAPALKAADVGIAVGARASDIARQTADVVLESSDLRSILAAIGEGRIVHDNLRRSIRFLFASNLSEILLSLAGVAVASEPLSSLQLLWINLLTDTLPGLALALEPGDPSVLARPPAPHDAPLLSGADWRRIGRDGAFLGALGAVGFSLGGSMGAFSTLTAAQLSYAMTCRAEEMPPGPRFGRLLGGAVGLQLAALVLPPLRGLLGLPAAAALGLAGFGGTAFGFATPLAVKAVARRAAQGCSIQEVAQGAAS